MPRIIRKDRPGQWHHVMHRGIAKRTVFETRQDARTFLAQLARAVRRGDLEIHAYCLMGNHFHTLARSPRGRLSEAMQRILNAYVRYFNRRRRRDGPLFRGRFRSKPVETLAYRRVLVRYIDHNPVAGGVVKRAKDHAWGSAQHYETHGGPVWLSRGWIEAEVRAASRKERYDPREYGPCFGKPLTDELKDWVERRIEAPVSEHDPLDDLLSAQQPDVRRWMQWKADLADGTSPGWAVVTPDMVEAEAAHLAADWRVPRSSQRELDARDLAHAGLLSDACGLSHREISLRLRMPRSTVQGRLTAHRRALLEDPEYLKRCSAITHAALQRMKEAVGRDP